jgi:hypothetical protein
VPGLGEEDRVARVEVAAEQLLVEGISGFGG